MERFIQTHTAWVELFFNIFTSELTRLLYRGTKYSIPVPYKSVAWDWNYCVTLISACHSENADWKGISWGVRKDGLQLSMLTPSALLCVLTSVVLAPTWRTIFWTTGASWQFCAKRSGRFAGNVCLRSYALYIQKLYHRSHFTVGGSWNKNFQRQPLQRCYFANSGSPASACVMRRRYSITYTQYLHAINVLLAVGREGILLCGCFSYVDWFKSRTT